MNIAADENEYDDNDSDAGADIEPTSTHCTSAAVGALFSFGVFVFGALFAVFQSVLSPFVAVLCAATGAAVVSFAIAATKASFRDVVTSLSQRDGADNALHEMVKTESIYDEKALKRRFNLNKREWNKVFYCLDISLNMFICIFFLLRMPFLYACL